MKVKILGVAIALSSLFVPTVARAEWVKVVSSTSGTKMYVDPSSISNFGSTVVFSMKSVSRDHVIKEYTAANCQTGQFQKQELIQDGVQIHPQEGQFPVEQAPMGSLYGAAIQFACGSH